jgi:hypothetical protein
MHYLGLYADGALLSAALVKRHKRKIQIEWTRSIKSDVKPLYILAHELAPYRHFVVTGLPSDSVLVRHLQMGLTSKRRILSVLPFQLEGMLPYPVEESVLQPTITRLNKKEAAVTTFSTAIKKVEEHLSEWAERGIDPEVVSSTPMALFRFARYLFPQDNSLVVFHLGNQEICAIVIENGRLVEIVDTPSLLKPHHLERLVAFLMQKAPEKTPVFFTGLSPESSSIRVQLEKRLAPHFSLRVPPIDRASEIPHAVSIGLALDALHADSLSVQFRQKPSEKIKKSHRRSLTNALTAGLSSFLCILLIGGVSIGNQKKELLKELRESFPHSGPRLKPAIESAQRSLLRSKPSPIPMMQVRTASEVLAWLSDHPKLQDEQVVLKRVRYALEKSPRLSSPKILPLVRVELEIATPSARLARDFRQALLADRIMIDQRRNIKWANEESNYRAVFYLRTAS